MNRPELFAPLDRAAGETPLRPRDPLRPTCLSFGPDNDGFELFISATAYQHLTRGTADAAPAEVFGLLMGRCYSDRFGPYTVVTAAVAAADVDAGPGRVVVPGHTLADLKREGELAHPAADVVGWWHSHPHRSGFSFVDRAEQSTWPSSSHVGILTFMSGDGVGAYRGPATRRLVSGDGPALGNAAPRSSRPAGGTAAPARPDRQQRRWPLGLAALVGLAGLAVGAANIAGVTPRPSPSAAAPVTATRPVAVAREPAPASVDWSCTPSTEALRCAGPVGVGIVGWHWSIDGEPASAGPDVVFRSPGHGPHEVGLVVITTRGTVDAGRQTLVVEGPPPDLAWPQ